MIDNLNFPQNGWCLNGGTKGGALEKIYEEDEDEEEEEERTEGGESERIKSSEDNKEGDNEVWSWSDCGDQTHSEHHRERAGEVFQTT